MTLRLALVASVAAGLAFAAPSNAGCYGTPDNHACTENREVYRECVYTGGTTCKWVTVSAPTCGYGVIANNQFITWC